MFGNIKRNTLLYQFSGFNIFAIGLLGAAFHRGFVTQIYKADVSHMTSIISLVFLAGLVISLWRAIQLNKANNSPDVFFFGRDVNHANQRDDRKSRIEAWGLFLSAKLQIVQHLTVLVFLLGICGTMIGIILALKSTESFSTADQSNMLIAIVLLFQGVYVKFYASLVGIIAHMWLLTNYNMLCSSSRQLLARLIIRA